MSDVILIIIGRNRVFTKLRSIHQSVVKVSEGLRQCYIKTVHYYGKYEKIKRSRLFQIILLINMCICEDKY